MSATGLVLVYSLNTWLPELMLPRRVQREGFAVVPAGAQRRRRVGALLGSRVADRFGPKPVVATCFLIGALAIAVLTLSLPLGVLLAFVAIVGLGTSGTQTLIYGFVANYYRTNIRGAGVAWCAGFGRLGGVGGPLLGGFLIGGRPRARTRSSTCWPGWRLLGLVLTLLVPTAHRRSSCTRRRSSLPVTTVPAAATTPSVVTPVEAGGLEEERCTTGSWWRSTRHPTPLTTPCGGPRSSRR